MLRESDEPDAFNIALIEHIAQMCLANGLVVIVEGILDARRYGAMLERLARGVTHSLFYSFDLTFEETLVRHAGRPQAATIPEEAMAQWYHGWQPLPFVDELRIGATWTVEEVVDRIHGDVSAGRAAP
ncbi:hypothetical protein DFR70_11422 [Nocardia tenerifensis]|uniref:Kinase n=2 Tax=Nocardia tenerifensis TaxID=228006 RepID=A0A318JXC1_9NOCA|nr:hypothetical protein DFR70_11422 [Nocardia tenerifensis]